VITYVQRIDPRTWTLLDETAVRAACVQILGVDHFGNVFVPIFTTRRAKDMA
jgi:hypothetical protein